MNYTSVTNPAYADERNRMINCLVKFSAFEKAMPFTASPDDAEPYSRQILAELKAGKYGPIEPYEG